MATAKSVLQRVVTQLSDDTSVRWTITELIHYLNDGQREIITYRPDATATTASVALVPGARQELPAAAYKLLDVYRNTGGTKAAVRKIDQKLLDAQLPNWQNGTTNVTIKHYMYDVREISIFYVYPPAANGASLEMMYSAKPTDIDEQTSLADVTGDLSVRDIFANALFDYVMYRAAAKDAEYSGNVTRASAHYSAFQQALGIEASATSVVTPKK